MADRRSPTTQTPTQDHSMKDHDLLIRLDENMRGLRADVMEIKDGSERRLSELENNVIKRIEFYPVKRDVDALKVKQATYTGALAVLQVVLAVVLWYFSK